MRKYQKFAKNFEFHLILTHCYNLNNEARTFWLCYLCRYFFAYRHRYFCIIIINRVTVTNQRNITTRG